MAAVACAHTQTTPHPEGARVRSAWDDTTLQQQPSAIVFPNLQVWVLVPFALPRGGGVRFGAWGLVATAPTR